MNIACTLWTVHPCPQALDGFILTALSDGTVVYLSDNIHKHLGLFQSEHIGYSMYDMIFEEDHEEVKRKVHVAEATALARLSSRGVCVCVCVCVCVFVCTCTRCVCVCV